MDDDQGYLRVSNADRDDAIARLQEALDEGRIDLAEFEERSGAAYEAKTDAELDLLFADLPRTGAEAVRAVPDRRERETQAEAHEDGGHPLPGMVRAIIWVACTTVPIWLFFFISTGSTQGYWPLCPILALSGIAVAQRLAGKRERG